MTLEQLKRANKLQEEIKELEFFIWKAESIWTGKLIERNSTYIFKINVYGTFQGSEYNLDNEMKDRVLDVLRARLKELRQELERI